MGKDLNTHFSKEDIRMTNTHIKRCSASVIIREMQIKTTMRYHLTLIRMTIIKKIRNSKCWDFPGSPVVKTSPSNAGGAGLIPGQGTKVPQASRPKNQNMKQKQYCKKFNKDLKKKKRKKQQVLEEI